METDYNSRIQEARSYIQEIYDQPIDLALILGTGLSGIRDEIEVLHTIPYSNIPHYPQSTVTGHEGLMIIGNWYQKTVLVLSGRLHCYEGYTAQQVTFPIRIIQSLQVPHLWISNVAGGLRAHYQAGDIVLIKDHINLMPDHPLQGPNDIRLGIRFPDMKEAYSTSWMQRFAEAAHDLDISHHKGVYVGLQGPSLETPAEYNMLHILGADVVGMSTVPEVIVAKHAEIEVMVCSIVSNVCYPPDRITETTLEEVIAVAHAAGDQLKRIWSHMIQKMGKSE